MATVILILPLEATTVNNPSNRRSDSGVTAVVKMEQQQERWQSKMEPRTQLQSLNARIQGYEVSTLTVFYNGSIVIPAVACIFHGPHLKRQNQDNGFHQ